MESWVEKDMVLLVRRETKASPHDADRARRARGEIFMVIGHRGKRS